MVYKHRKICMTKCWAGFANEDSSCSPTVLSCHFLLETTCLILFLSTAMRKLSLNSAPISYFPLCTYLPHLLLSSLLFPLSLSFPPLPLLCPLISHCIPSYSITPGSLVPSLIAPFLIHPLPYFPHPSFAPPSFALSFIYPCLHLTPLHFPLLHLPPPSFPPSFIFPLFHFPPLSFPPLSFPPSLICPSPLALPPLLPHFLPSFVPLPLFVLSSP